MSQQISTILPDVHLKDGHPKTTSINIAKVFGKRHDNVLRDIKSMEIPEQFSLLNFEESDYKNSRGKMMPMYEITRDGFALLAMGFTGARAMQWKIAFIEAFNRLEMALRQKILEEQNHLKDEIIVRDGRIIRLQRELSDFKDVLFSYMKDKAKKGTRMTREEVLEIKKMYANSYSKAEIGRRICRSAGLVNRAINMSVSEAVLGARHVH